MKVSDLLSYATIGSSRALSVYAAIVSVILWTDTPAAKIPPVNLLTAQPLEIYSIALGLLLFMTAAHGINLRNDTLSARQDLKTSEAKSIENASEILSRAAEDKEPSIWAEDIRDAYVAASEAREKMKGWKRVIVFGMHLTVPVGLALIAAAWLSVKIHQCWNTVCC